MKMHGPKRSDPKDDIRPFLRRDSENAGKGGRLTRFPDYRRLMSGGKRRQTDSEVPIAMAVMLGGLC